MIITVDEKEIEIPKELIHLMSLSAQPEFQNLYERAEPRIKLAIKTALRTFVFPWIEKKTGIAMRPEKNVDPLLYLIDLFSGIVEDVSQYVNINLTTINVGGEAYRPTAFSFTIKNQSEGGRQLAFSWSQGERKNSFLENTSQSLD